jgi:hypothetical protein
MEIRLPQINADTDRGQLAQIKSYLYQLAEQLNWGLVNLQPDSFATNSTNPTKVIQSGQSGENPKAEAENTFNSIKGLIIKSADIVNAFYEEISKRLEGEYVAQSDFGTFKESTESTLTATSKALEIKFSNDQEISADGNTIEYTAIRSADAWVKVGILDYTGNGFPIYGMEIGQYDTDGEGTELRSARYLPGGVELYGSDQDNPVVVIDQATLTITNVKISKSLTLGGYLIDVEKNDGIVFKWIGGGV